MAAIAQSHDLGTGFWRLADPKITLASMSSILLGVAAAVHSGAQAWGWLVVIVIGIFAPEWAKNASGEIYDFASGADQAVAEADRSPFSGGKRVLVDGLLTGTRNLGHRDRGLRVVYFRGADHRAVARTLGAVARARRRGAGVLLSRTTVQALVSRVG